MTKSKVSIVENAFIILCFKFVVKDSIILFIHFLFHSGVFDAVANEILTSADAQYLGLCKQ